VTMFLTGDVIERRKGPVMHKGVVLPDGRVLHNTPRRGEHVSTLSEFAAGHRVYLSRRTCDASRARAWSAYPQAGGSYNLFTNNCEHTVSRVAHGRAESPQLRGFITGGLVGLLTLLVTRSPGAAAAGFEAGRRFAAG